MRNLTFNDIDTLGCDPRMPYEVRRKNEYSNLWFSSSDGHTVYTHFASGFVGPDGRVEAPFRRAIEDLAGRAGWFVPVGALLDHLRASHAADADPGYGYELALNLRWLADRIVKKVRYRR